MAVGKSKAVSVLGRTLLLVGIALVAVAVALFFRQDSADLSWALPTTGQPVDSPNAQAGSDTGQTLAVTPDLYTAGGGEQNVYFGSGGNCVAARMKFDWEQVAVTIGSEETSTPERYVFTLLGSEDVTLILDSTGKTITLLSSGNEQIMALAKPICIRTTDSAATGGSDFVNLSLMHFPYHRTIAALGAILLLAGAGMLRWSRRDRAGLGDLTA